MDYRIIIVTVIFIVVLVVGYLVLCFCSCHPKLGNGWLAERVAAVEQIARNAEAERDTEAQTQLQKNKPTLHSAEPQSAHQAHNLTEMIPLAAQSSTETNGTKPAHVGFLVQMPSSSKPNGTDTTEDRIEFGTVTVHQNSKLQTS
ncbi:SubName: Full=Uncharacterized protein {ECO:0000313/EMBL:CCA67753.1} [Serendipita indica DSM 11827]|uniref:Uncharacterized protein n=1 Tax=Serendipita indica (strain DSM 11827) TaxID=1109443 RepID=G4T8V1_SERID|nr:SubName: Full=Uncharacterized protein {ECO:0000313/EMBL:CCA67753.1} [Serendipita indica DSM 11827]CCA67753.1 hypothetical protein PIIN_01577 [Serendipita indica DSM 11827]